MSTRTRYVDDLPTAFLLRDANGMGVSRDRLRGARWQRLSRGLYAVRADCRTPYDTARALSQVLPRDSGFGHLTSAALRGWWLPLGLPPHVTFATTRSGVHVQRRGLYVRRSPIAEYDDLGGLALTSAPQTLLELARDLSLVDLVPMVDCALRLGTDRTSVLGAARPRVAGAGRLRHAVSLADERSESWWESVLRLLHVLTELGPVDAQVEIWERGGFVARADLHLVGTRRYPEVDGGRHREKERHGRDLRRDRRMSRGGFERYGYTAEEIAVSPAMIIRDAEEARGHAHDPGRLRRWWSYARASTLTPYGRTRLAGRLQRYRLAADRRVARSGAASAERGAFR